MNMRKTVSFLGSLLILVSGIVFAQEQQEQSKAQVRKEEQKVVQNQVQTKVEERVRARLLFVDENGDGINDFARDHDNDGIPNCQDPDWTPPEDGSGYMNRYRNASEANRFEYRNRLYSGNGWNKASFKNCFSNVTRSAQGRSSQRGKSSKRSGR
ncbi:MAG: hypothetical protein PVF66_08975 [Candidatus Aminicenantes bacterium]|jgi:hypothetical protein